MQLFFDFLKQIIFFTRLIMDSGSTCKNATVSLHAKKYDESWTAGGQWFDWEAIQLEAIGE